MAFKTKFADLSKAAGAGGDGSIGQAWDFETALTSAPADSVTFVKWHSRAFDASGGGLDVGNGGTLGDETHVKFVMYKDVGGYSETTLETDMDPGGDYYGGPLDAYRSENSKALRNADAVWGDIDGGGSLADDLLTIDGKDNVEFRGFKFHGTDKESNNHVIQLANNPEGLRFSNCKLDTGNTAVNGVLVTGLFDNCYIGDDFPAAVAVVFSPNMSFGVVDSCIFNIPADMTGLAIRNGMSVKNSVFIGGTYGVRAVPYAGTVHNCTFYNQTSGGILANSNNAQINEYNNIFNPAAINDNAVFISAGNNLYSDYSLAWSLAGKMTAGNGQYPWEFDHVSVNTSFAGQNVITDRNPNLNTWNFKTQVPFYGRPDADGNRALIGARLPDLGPHERHRTRHSGYDMGWRL